VQAAMQLKRKQSFPSLSSQDEPALREAILHKLTYELGKTADRAALQDWYQATALAVRDRIIEVWLRTNAETMSRKKKRVYYLSIEFLIGRLLFDALTNLRLVEPAKRALADLGQDFDELRAIEPDAALGNGGLGRLAACFMDSMAALQIPAFGYGIRYENGLFEQRLHDGWQHEIPEDWLAGGNPWEFRRNAPEYTICFGGAVEYIGGDEKTPRAIWYPEERVLAVPYDTPVVGWRGRHVNALRLWSARTATPIQLSAFNKGDYVGAVAARARGALRHARGRLARPPRQRAAALVRTDGDSDPARRLQQGRLCRRGRRARARRGNFKRALSE